MYNKRVERLVDPISVDENNGNNGRSTNGSFQWKKERVKEKLASGQGVQGWLLELMRDEIIQQLKHELSKLRRDACRYTASLLSRYTILIIIIIMIFNSVRTATYLNRSISLSICVPKNSCSFTREKCCVSITRVRKTGTFLLELCVQERTMMNTAVSRKLLASTRGTIPRACGSGSTGNCQRPQYWTQQLREKPVSGIEIYSRN